MTNVVGPKHFLNKIFTIDPRLKQILFSLLELVSRRGRLKRTDLHII